MTGHVYRCIPAPRRARTTREHRTPAEALAAAVQAVLNAEAAQGWEYVRTDLTPMEARAGLFGGVTETHQGVMVFRRPAEAVLGLGPRPHAAAEPAPQIPRLGSARID